MIPVKVRHDAENMIMTLTQEGYPGLTIHEGDLRTLLDAITYEDCQEIFYNGRFRVHQEKRNVILTLFDSTSKAVPWKACVVLSKKQASTLVSKLESAFDALLREYNN